jgi:hypothetical protein
MMPPRPTSHHQSKYYGKYPITQEHFIDDEGGAGWQSEEDPPPADGSMKEDPYYRQHGDVHYDGKRPDEDESSSRSHGGRGNRNEVRNSAGDISSPLAAANDADWERYHGSIIALRRS